MVLRLNMSSSHVPRQDSAAGILLSARSSFPVRLMVNGGSWQTHPGATGATITVGPELSRGG